MSRSIVLINRFTSESQPLLGSHSVSKFIKQLLSLYRHSRKKYRGWTNLKQCPKLDSLTGDSWMSEMNSQKIIWQRQLQPLCHGFSSKRCLCSHSQNVTFWVIFWCHCILENVLSLGWTGTFLTACGSGYFKSCTSGVAFRQWICYEWVINCFNKIVTPWNRKQYDFCASTYNFTIFFIL